MLFSFSWLRKRKYCVIRYFVTWQKKNKKQKEKQRTLFELSWFTPWNTLPKIIELSSNWNHKADEGQLLIAVVNSEDCYYIFGNLVILKLVFLQRRKKVGSKQYQKSETVMVISIVFIQLFIHLFIWTFFVNKNFLIN